jgi:pilus assembly protein Flp/PilA
MRRLIELLTETSGASASEYALILAIIGGAIAIASIALGASISNSVNRSTTDIQTCGGGC